jgi:hypothetical protein
MKTFVALILFSTSAMAYDYQAEFNKCLNSQGSSFAWMRQSYCEKNVNKTELNPVALNNIESMRKLREEVLRDARNNPNVSCKTLWSGSHEIVCSSL